MKEKKTAVALGSFDGVHLGHISVLKSSASFRLTDDFEPVALVFDKHPREAFGKNVELLLNSDERNKLIESYGTKPISIAFNSIKNMSPEEFVSEIIVKKLNAGAVCCGYNYHFGRQSSGDSEILKTICKEYGIKVKICDKISVDGQDVSSSVIRSYIKNGEIEKANKMLDRPYFFINEVLHGAENGHKMGFPTINQYFGDNMIIPKIGVYVSSTEVDGKIYQSFTDIGRRPTVTGEGEIRAETHIFDFDADLYGENIKVSLHKYLRGEFKFESFEELINQLNKDKVSVRSYFDNK